MRDAERRESAEQRVQHVDGGARVGQCAVVGRDRRPEEGRERAELVVRGLVAGHDAARQAHRVEHLVAGPRVARLGGGRLEEPDVEGRVVRDEDRPARELQEAGQDLRDAGCADHHRGRDAGQHRDERRHRTARVDERLELPEDLASSHLDGADLGDRARARGAARRLEVDDHERDVRQRCTELVERELHRPARRRWRQVAAAQRPALTGDRHHAQEASRSDRHGASAGSLPRSRWRVATWGGRPDDGQPAGGAAPVGSLTPACRRPRLACRS